ncbi:MAG: hypothetical protein P8179_23965 [Candidatus Thiodiazotropha sp.]|jgi:hypothetical protein
MIKYAYFPLVLTLAANAHATCVPDTLEIGDSGPGSFQVCQVLGDHYPDANINILNRTIQAADKVSILVSVNGQMQWIAYQLAGPDWVPVDSRINTNQ